jgi:hypothetical protein
MPYVDAAGARLYFEERGPGLPGHFHSRVWIGLPRVGDPGALLLASVSLHHL